MSKDVCSHTVSIGAILTFPVSWPYLRSIYTSSSFDKIWRFGGGEREAREKNRRKVARRTT